MPSPLFQTAAREVRRAASAAFERSTLGRLDREIQRLRRDPAASGKAAQLAEKYRKKLSPHNLGRELRSTPLGRMISEVERYAKGEGLAKELAMQLLGALGPFGRILQQAMRQTGKLTGVLDDQAAQLKLAEEMIKTHGGEVFWSLPSLLSAADRLREGGYETSRVEDLKAPRRRRVQDEITGEDLVMPGRRTETDVSRFEESPAGGVRIDKRTPEGKWLTTGIFVSVEANSSNVHSIAYDVDARQLYVRFQGGRGKRRGGPGPLYRYDEVFADEARALYRARNTSAGGWVWDNLRIRGTVAGHKKTYRLVGISGGYVPRRALWHGGKEWYVQRQIQMKGKTLVSGLPTQLVPTAHKDATPNRGKPNTGRP